MNQDRDVVVPLMGVLMTRRAVLLEFVYPTQADGERLLTNTGSSLQQAHGVYVESNSANGQLLTLSLGKRQGTFYSHSINDGKHKKSRPQYPAEGGAKSPGTYPLALRHKALVVVWLLATLLKSVCTEGTLSQSATRVSSGGPKDPQVLFPPYKGAILQLASHNCRRRKNVGVSNAELIKLPHVMQ